MAKAVSLLTNEINTKQKTLPHQVALIDTNDTEAEKLKRKSEKHHLSQ